MLHKITMSESNYGDLYVIYLDSVGKAHYCQITGPGASSASAPFPPQGTAGPKFQALLRMGPGFGVLALDQSGYLWFINYTVSNGKATWNPNGFTQFLDKNGNPTPQITDLDASTVRGYPVFICSVGPNQAVLGQAGGISSSLMPQQLMSSNPARPLRSHAIGVLGIDPRDEAPQGGDTPTVLLFGLTMDNEGNNTFMAAWNQNGSDQAAQGWNTLNIQSDLNMVDRIAALTLGANGKPLAIVIQPAGSAYVFSDSSGVGKAWNLNTQNQGLLFGPMTPRAIAVSNGSDGNMQFVALSMAPPGRPYLVFQQRGDASGNFIPYPLTNGQLKVSCPANVSLLDLATGFFGNQGLLQVCYLGSDGNVYGNSQNPKGDWSAFGPL